MSHPRIWSLEEANAFVPRLSILVEQQLKRAAEIRNHLAQYSGEQKARRHLVSVSGSRHGGGVTVNVSPNDKILRERIASYEEGWKAIESLGLVVKDPHIGLCDFYGYVEGKLVFLCWKYGEATVEHYHSLDAGYAGRRPISSETVSRLLN